MTPHHYGPRQHHTTRRPPSPAPPPPLHLQTEEKESTIQQKQESTKARIHTKEQTHTRTDTYTHTHLRWRGRLPPAAHHLARGREVVQQPAGRAVRGVHGAQEAPGLRQQLPHRRGLHGSEELSSVDASEVRQVAKKVDALRHDREAGHLVGVSSNLQYDDDYAGPPRARV